MVKTLKPKVTLLSEKLWVIRSTKVRKNGSVDVMYYETPSTWNRSPMDAVLFQNYESAEGHLRLFRQRDMPATTVWWDGATETIDVVPFLGCLAGAR